MKKYLLTAIATTALATIGSTTEAAVMYETTVTSKDQIIGERQSSAPALGYYVDASGGQVGVDGSTATFMRKNVLPIIGLMLPVLGAGESIESAQLSFSVTAIQDSGNAHTLGSLDTYLLNSANPSTTGTTFFYEGSGDPSANVEFVGRTTRSQLGVNTSAGGINPQQTFTPAKQITYALTGDALALLQSFYLGGVPTQTEAFLRWNSSTNLNVADTDRYFIDPNSPKLTITATAVPEPGTVAVLGVTSLLMLARRQRRNSGALV